MYLIESYTAISTCAVKLLATVMGLHSSSQILTKKNGLYIDDNIASAFVMLSVSAAELFACEKAGVLPHACS